MAEENKVKKQDLPVISKTQRNDFVEIKYTGYSNGNVFDSNVEEDLKKINPEAKTEKTVVIIGEGMLVSGFDKALEGKEIGKEYEIELKPKDAFGDRKRELVKTIPLKIFREKQIDPRPGMAFNLDNMIAKVIAVSGARVITDFNNPLSGKDVKYKFTIVRKVEDEKEKCDAVFVLMFRGIPEYEIKEKIILKGPKQLKMFVDSFAKRFKELVGKELDFEEKKPEKKEETKGEDENKAEYETEKKAEEKAVK